MDMKKLVLPMIVILTVGALGVLGFSLWPGHVHGKISYPYVCDTCEAVVDVSELKEDYPKNWRIPPKSPSDSVVLCLRCNKGWARPVGECQKCGTQYVLYLGDNRCPKCFPEAAEKVKKATGKDSLFKQP